MTINKVSNLGSRKLEFHILQSFPPTCLNRDDVGSPKSAIVGGSLRARVSSQCWKRQIRQSMHELSNSETAGIRTKRLDHLCKEFFTDGIPEDLSKKLLQETLIFISEKEAEAIKKYVSENLAKLKTKEEEKKFWQNFWHESLSASGIDAEDIALFGRMVARAPEMDIEAAASFSHAISTHRVESEIDFFTAMDDLSADDKQGASHLGVKEFNSAVYYRYISLNIDQLKNNLKGIEISSTIERFIKALYVAVPIACQTTLSGASPWGFARILLRRGQRIQVPFDTAVWAKTSESYLGKSIENLQEELEHYRSQSGSLFQADGDWTLGGNKDNKDSINKTGSTQVNNIDELINQIQGEIEQENSSIERSEENGDC